MRNFLKGKGEDSKRFDGVGFSIVLEFGEGEALEDFLRGGRIGESSIGSEGTWRYAMIFQEFYIYFSH